jgi:hypothetical protein
MSRSTRSGLSARSPLGAFVDSLLQAFEDRRAGLRDDALSADQAEPFFAELYQRERERLDETLRLADPQLEPARRERLHGEVDGFAHKVLVPAYARMAASFTARERNDFFLVTGAARPFERVGFAVAGLVLGGLVVWAPFIPLWSREWIAIFGLGGIFVPELRRYLAWRRYEGALNDLVARSDRELERLRTAYLLGEATAEAATPPSLPPKDR